MKAPELSQHDRMMHENRIRAREAKQARQEQREFLHEIQRSANAKKSGIGAKECARRVKQGHGSGTL